MAKGRGACAAGAVGGDGLTLDGRAELLAALDAVGEQVERIGQAARAALATGDPAPVAALDLAAAHAAKRALVDALARVRGD